MNAYIDIGGSEVLTTALLTPSDYPLLPIARSNV